MIHVSDIYTTPPAVCSTDLQQIVYDRLEGLHIPYQRVETDEVITMEDCAAVDEKLEMQMVKTLFLCNRQQTEFYLFVTRGSKPFRAKEFSAALGVARVSFAPAELMQTMLHTKIGAATVFSALLPAARCVRLTVDTEVLAQEWYGCSDGTTTGYMKVRTADVFHKLLPSSGVIAEAVSV